jgi:heme a synthase
VFAMVVVGGATRLTESGLSIVYWEPFKGAIPPLSAADWAQEFARYKQSPQYQQVNAGMSLAQFQTIFWWEWAHRQLGRFIGLAFALPLILLLWHHGAALKPWRGRLVMLLLLGGLQGAIGWWMVASGLVHEPMVSPLRLATHLGMALLIFALLLWTVLDVRARLSPPAPPNRSLAAGARVLIWLMVFQILLGALVAGNDAGLASDSWPMMDGRFIPRGMLEESPWWRNDLLLHWLHRSFAWVVAGHALAMAVLLVKRGSVHMGYALLGAMILQFLIGILTVLYQVPVLLGTLHQGNVVLLLAACVWFLHRETAQWKRPEISG